MPPNEVCPNCNHKVEDWHVEWYKTEGHLLFRGLAAMDCPVCRQAVGFQQGKIGPAPPGIPVVRRYVDRAAEWAPLGANYAVYTAIPGKYASPKVTPLRYNVKAGRQSVNFELVD
jgi:hypothetical protein